MTTSPPFVRIIDGLCAHRRRTRSPAARPAHAQRRGTRGQRGRMADSPTSQAHSRAADLRIRWWFHTVRASIPPSFTAQIGWMSIGWMSIGWVGRRAEPPHVLAVTPRTGNHHPAWVGWFQKLWVEHGALPCEPVPHTPRSRCMPSQKALPHFCQRENHSLLPRRKRERISKRKMSPENGKSASLPSPSIERRALLAVETQPHPFNVHVLADGAGLGNRNDCRHSSATVHRLWEELTSDFQGFIQNIPIDSMVPFPALLGKSPVFRFRHR